MIQVFEGHLEASDQLRGSFVAIGNFDGLHLGHQALIQKTIEKAKEKGALSAVYTFSPHPKQAALLMTREQKIKGLEKLGVQAVVIEPFTEQFAKISPEDFLKKVLLNGLGVSGVAVGANFKFGHQAKGDLALLKALEAKGVEVLVVDAVKVGDEVCSSTLIRQKIFSGKVEEAAKLLGRLYLLEGIVVHGQGRGAGIGFPTANLLTKQEVLPGKGVYVTRVSGGEIPKKFLAVTNVGSRPTFDNDGVLSIETHLLDFSGDLYGQNLEISFVKKIRDEKKFNSVDELKAQIREDVETARHSN